MTVTSVDLKRLVRRHSVIGHPFLRVLMKTDRAKRPWRIAAQGLEWDCKAWPEYRSIILDRAPAELGTLLAGLEPVGPAVPSSSSEGAEAPEEVQEYVAWFLDMLARADLSFALGGFYGHEDTFDILFGALELPEGWSIKPMSGIWDQIMPAANLAEAYLGVQASQAVIARLLEWMLDEAHIMNCPDCKVPMRLTSETLDRFWCKRCQKEIEL